MSTLLDRLAGGLIVSAQAWTGSAIDDPVVLAAMAAAAEANGACGIRMQGVTNLAAGRQRVSLPLIGLIKRAYEGFEPYITPTLREVEEVAGTGAEIVAFDATNRVRPAGTTLRSIVDAIHARGRLAMADCSTVADGVGAQAAGADIIATTLCGYTRETKGTPLPALALLREFAQLEAFVIAEGGIHDPEMVRDAFECGANAVVVGTAITNTDWLVRAFVARTERGARQP